MINQPKINQPNNEVIKIRDLGGGFLRPDTDGGEEEGQNIDENGFHEKFIIFYQISQLPHIRPSHTHNWKQNMKNTKKRWNNNHNNQSSKNQIDLWLGRILPWISLERTISHHLGLEKRWRRGCSGIVSWSWSWGRSSWDDLISPIFIIPKWMIDWLNQ